MAYFLCNALAYLVNVSAQSNIIIIIVCWMVNVVNGSEGKWAEPRMRITKVNIGINVKFNLKTIQFQTYSVIRTAKLFPLDTSYHPISCRIIAWKNFTRIRVICFMAVWLSRSTQKIPLTNCNNAVNVIRMPYATESLIISIRFSSHVAFVLSHSK